MKNFLVLCLCCTLVLPPNALAFGTVAEDNPFVEAMLRMMEVFGLINRNSLPLGAPYLTGYGQQLVPGLGGFGGIPGMSPMSGLGGIPGMSPMSGLGGVPGMSPMLGFGGVPGMSPLSGIGGFPAAGSMPGVTGWPGGGFPTFGGTPGNRNSPNWYTQGSTINTAAAYLDGIWELENGGFVIIKGNNARLYLSREQYQDFAIGYDRQYLWWKPQQGGAPSRYLYQTREGRMILRDAEGNLLLLRRRR